MRVIQIEANIHHSVCIGKYCIIGKVSIGKGTKIGNYVEIGDGCEIGENVIIQGRNRFGNNCKIKNDVVVKYGAILTNNLIINTGAFIGVNAVTLGSDKEKIEIGGTFIGKDCYIGGYAIIAPGLKIPAGTIVGANSFLREIKGKGTYVGTPAKKIK